MKKLRVMLFISIMINLVLMIGIGTLFLKSDGMNRVSAFIKGRTDSYADNPYYQERTSLFEELESPEYPIVFLGDSITQRAEWKELLPYAPNVINRGIGSDTTEGIYSRLDDILKSTPSKIFIMAGINDLAKNLPIEEITQNYDNIIQKIRTQSPGTQIYIQSVLPVNSEKYGSLIDNQEVKQLNKELTFLAKENNIKYIDVAGKLSNGNELASEFTVDGVHLLGTAYKKWVKILNQYVVN